ncbi:MAG: PilZ domain-containing protein [Candidatus Omnitrophica bacterium]|nr:PilZ domain-containing protein [Candidatus Omnitrophota bacterium]
MASRLSGDRDLPQRILDRRRGIRLDESLPFQIGHKGYEIQGVSINISSSGIYCLVDKDISMMTKLDLCLFLPSMEKRKARKIRVRGVVVRKQKDPVTEKFYLAIYFSRIKPADQTFLDNYIQRRLKK